MNGSVETFIEKIAEFWIENGGNSDDVRYYWAAIRHRVEKLENFEMEKRELRQQLGE